MDASPPSPGASPGKTPARYAFAALILANLVLALGPWMVRLADVGPIAAAFWRLALAIPFLVWLALRSQRGRGIPSWTILATIAVGGLFFAADLAAWHEGIVRTKLANATLFGNISAFLFAIYGFVLMRSLPRPVQTGALLLAAAGTILLLGGSYELSPEHVAGDLLAILAGLFYTFYLVAVERARTVLAPMPVLAISTAAGAAPLLLLAMAAGQTIMPTDWTPVVLLSISSQLVGQGLLVYAMGHLTPLVVGLGLLTQPIVSALIGWLAYDERMSALDGLGAILIAVALVLIRLPARRRAA